MKRNDSLKNIRLDLSYDGTNYAGWQIQDNANTIEQELRSALNRLQIDYRNFAASGRTDSGVHALNQTVSFLTDSTIPPAAFSKALNTALPQDIVVLRSQEVDSDFHARYSALAKQYSYRVDLSEISNPFHSRYSWHYPYPIDTDRLEEMAKFLAGKHDYSAFRKVGSSVKTSIREIYTIVPKIEEGTTR